MIRSVKHKPFLIPFTAILAVTALSCSEDSVTGTPLNCESGYTICGSSCCDKECIDNVCMDTKNDVNNCGEPGNKCPPNEICAQGVCTNPASTCVSPQKWCNGNCVNIESDPNNCGECNRSCKSNETCRDSDCFMGCATGFTRCEPGICVDLVRDSEHCGNCDTVCGDHMLCSNNSCVCQLGHHDCDGDPSNGCESIQACQTIPQPAPCDGACTSSQACIHELCVDNTDIGGTCDPACDEGKTCVNAECVDDTDIVYTCDPVCLSDQTCIMGECVDNVQEDVCDPPCGSDQTCVQGECQPNATTCQSNESLCFGKCFDLSNDHEHCGNCLTACGDGEQCVQGKCELDCKSLTKCDGACFDTSQSKNHCGSCGHACNDGEACVGSACQCDGNHYDCDGNAANGCESTSPCSCVPGTKQKCWRGAASNLVDPADLSKGAKGICKVGEQTCDATGLFWGPCTGGVYPSSLTCDIFGNLNGLDNDCDGTPDTVCRSECDLAAGSMSYIGCEYWGAYIDNLITNKYSNHTFVLSNPNEKTANVYIYDRAHAVATTVEPYKTVTIAPHGVIAVEMNNLGYNMSKGSGILPNAFRIRSDIPITAYQFSPLGNPDAHSNDASLLLPANVMGKDYIGMTWVSQAQCGNGLNDHRSYLAVIATEPGNTTVTVTTTSDIAATDTTSIQVSSSQSINTTPITKVTKGGTATFTVPQYNVLTLMAPVGTNVTLPNSIHNQTGTRIQSDKNIAVFGGSRSSFVPAYTETTCCRDHIEEQLFPTQAWGKSYFAARAYSTGKAGDFWMITAKENNTTITLPANLTDIQKLNNVASNKKIGGTHILNAGETFPVFETRDSFEIHADKPISVGQFLPSKGYNGIAIGDPSFILTVPYEQYRSDYDFMVPEKFDVNYITIITPQDGKVQFDGTLLKSTDYISFQQLGSTNFYVGYYKVQPGVHHMVSDKPFGLYSYGYYDMSSYGYPIGLDLKILNTNSDG